ncbi:MAG: tetratricopeptide repeat protein [Balneolaceae bacterium]
MKIRSLFVLVLTVGLLGACETTSPFIQEAQLSLQMMEYEEALDLLDRALEEDSTNAVAYYYKGYSLGALAEDIQPPSDRRPYYEDMRSAMNNAKEFGAEMEQEPEEIADIDDFVISRWAYEHNAGAQIMTDDSTRQATSNPDQTAKIHFENAITIEPDSSISYIVLSSVQYQEGDIEEATETYELAMSKMDSPVFEDYEFLISLYFMQNRFQDAIDLSLEALEEYPEESVFAQFLADAYLETGEPEKAMNLIRQLVAENPDNHLYHYVLGTQLYGLAQEELDEASNKYRRAYEMEDRLSSLTASEQEELRQEVEQLRAEAEQAEREGNELADEAVQSIRNSLEISGDDDQSYNVLGIIYQNKAAALFEKRNHTNDNELARGFDEQAREELRSAMEYYERATEINPDEDEYWHALFQVYTTLGMDEEAEEAMERAGLENDMNN